MSQNEEESIEQLLEQLKISRAEDSQFAIEENLLKVGHWYERNIEDKSQVIEQEVETTEGVSIDVMCSVLKERASQFNKWGQQNHNLDRWITILVEEIGEFASDVQEDKPVQAYYEMVQVAAVAMQILDSMRRNELKDHFDNEE